MNRKHWPTCMAAGRFRCDCKTVKERAASLRALAKLCQKMAKKEPGTPSHPINYFGQTTWELAAIAALAKACEVELAAL